MEEVLKECKEVCSWRDMETIAEIYIAKCIEYNKLFDKFSARKAVYMIQAKMCNDREFIKQMAREVCS